MSTNTYVLLADALGIAVSLFGWAGWLTWKGALWIHEKVTDER